MKTLSQFLKDRQAVDGERRFQVAVSSDGVPPRPGLNSGPFARPISSGSHRPFARAGRVGFSRGSHG